MVCGPSYFHGEETEDRERGKGERHREWLTYLAANLEILIFVSQLAEGDQDFFMQSKDAMSHV